MADNIQEPQAISTPDPGQAELAQQMAFALGTPGSVAGPAVVAPEPAVIQPEVVSDRFSVFKDEFGWEAPEAAIQEIKDLRAFKAAPPAPEPFKFENADSERLAKAIQAGNHKEIHAILDQQIRIDSMIEKELDEASAADVIKLSMGLKYKDLTPKEIEWKFNRQYGIPAKPVQGMAEDAEEYQERVSAWQATVDDKKMELMFDAKLAKPELHSAKSKLVIPEIQQQVEPEYLEWKKAIEEEKGQRAETTNAYKTFTVKDLETKVPFNDEANKIAFDFQYEPDAEGFNRTIEMTADIEKFYSAFYKPDGTPDRQRFAKAIYFALNEEKVIVEAMKQAKNATIKAMLPDNSQSGGLVRQMVTAPGEPDELTKEMERRGIIRR